MPSIYIPLCLTQTNVHPRQKQVLVLLDRLNDLDPMVITQLNQGGTNTGALTRDAKRQVSLMGIHIPCGLLT
jgi:hypothetical protein